MVGTPLCKYHNNTTHLQLLIYFKSKEDLCDDCRRRIEMALVYRKQIAYTRGMLTLGDGTKCYVSSVHRGGDGSHPRIMAFGVETMSSSEAFGVSWMDWLDITFFIFSSKAESVMDAIRQMIETKHAMFIPRSLRVFMDCIRSTGEDPDSVLKRLVGEERYRRITLQALVEGSG